MIRKSINIFLAEKTRASIARQNLSIADVLDKSNNVLLQIEASRGIKPATNDSNSTPYTYNKETVNALTRVVDKFICLLNDRDQPVESRNFDLYLDAAGQRADYLGCNIRKLLAIWDTIQQMRIGLEREELEFASEESEME